MIGHLKVRLEPCSAVHREQKQSLRRFSQCVTLLQVYLKLRTLIGFLAFNKVLLMTKTKPLQQSVSSKTPRTKALKHSTQNETRFRIQHMVLLLSAVLPSHQPFASLTPRLRLTGVPREVYSQLLLQVNLAGKI